MKKIKKIKQRYEARLLPIITIILDLDQKRKKDNVKIVKFRNCCLFEFGKSATREGDVSIFGKHFCAGNIEAIRKIIDIY